ncbi:MAG: imidazole glycerol phosphate synthase subunit HisH [Candidatus Omnitrophica bacterium]|nr:imidazole glycerol phosphate synthase subunit HisH [Candidatus Omnitrophota bacterium]
MIAIVDYGMGNLRSVQKALESVGAKTKITQSQDDILKAEKIVLPGVGAFAVAIKKLESLNLINPLKKAVNSNKPFLGICLGLQLLFTESQEARGINGLDIFKGTVKKFKRLKVPHIGWNQIKINPDNSKLFKGIDDRANMYFCHSFYVEPKDKNIIAATTDYGMDFVSAVSQGNIFGVQFHPEKSQKVGLKILENFKKE